MNADEINSDLPDRAGTIKQTEKALLPLLIEGAGGYALFTTDELGIIDSWNEGAASVFGWPESEIVGKYFGLLFTQEDRATGQPQQELIKAAHEGQVPDVRWHLRNDGRRVFINGSIQPILGHSGAVRGFLKIVRDSTAQELAETALRETEEKYAALIATIDEGFVFGQAFHDSEDRLDFRLEAVNPAFERLAGRTAAQLVGSTARQVFSNVDEEWIQSFDSVGREGQTLNFERYSRTFSKWLSVRLAPFGPSGQGGIAVALTDITERKLQEEEMRQSEQLHRLLVESARDYALFTVDIKGCVTSWNEGLHRLSGYSENEIIGQHCRTFFPQADQVAKLPEKELKQAERRGRFEAEGWRVRKDGTRFWVNEILTAVKDADGQLFGYVKIARDLTDRRVAERDRRERERETALLAERHRMAQELHDTFAQGFTGIKLQINMAEYALGDTPPNIPEANRHMIRAREFAQQCQIETRRSISTLRSTLFDNLTLVEALGKLVNEVGASGPVTFSCRGRSIELPILVQNDIYRIGQEALTNALRHSGSSEIRMTLDYSPTEISLSVIDCGKGIETGTIAAGFGLTGIRERAQRIGAALEIDGKSGEGTSVLLRLPVQSTEAGR